MKNKHTPFFAATVFCLMFLTSPASLPAADAAPRIIYPDYYVSSPVRMLSDGRLALGLYAENDKTGFGAVGFSEDGGKTWQKAVDIDNGGIRLDAETDLIELKDGSLLIVYYEEGPGSNIRAKKFRATKSGIEWLKF